MEAVAAPERAWFASVGAFGGPAGLFGEGRGLSALAWMRLRNVVLVVEHVGGDVTLVDTGWSEAQCASPRREIGLPDMLLLGVSVRPGEDVASQLARAGVARDRVRRTVATHLHVDHVGGLEDFPNAEVVTTADELASARTRGRLHGFDVARLSRIGRLRLIELDGGARGAFAGSAALGEHVTLLDARGHTAGSLAVEVRLGARRLVHLGDAAYLLAEAERDRPSPLSRRTAWNPARQRETYRAVAEVARAPDVIAVTSHDPRTFAPVDGRTFTAA